MIIDWKDYVDHIFSVTCTNNIKQIEYVDLGLPSGLKWAKCNVGAKKETDYGLYFKWGETSGVSGSLVGKCSDENYSLASYKYCDGPYDTLTKYNTLSLYGENPDNITTLESVDDAATQIMGVDWRMPTKDEIQELIDNTDSEWVEDFNGTGVNGRKFTSKADTSKYIFIPAEGCCSYGSVYNVNYYGYVWSSSLGTSYSTNAWYLYFNSGSCYMSYNNRCDGQTVRGVMK